MKVFTPEISWHQKKPVFAVDFCKNTWKLASAGGDLTIKIWQVKVDEKEHAGLDFLSDLDRHDKAVNAVKFSPDGEFLASAGDDCIIILWKLATPEEEETKINKKAADEECFNKETWLVHKLFRRGHLGDIYDLAWSPDGTQLLSGSIDNAAILWNVKEGSFTKIMSEHKHFVQGVCWDPRGSYYASLSSDRTCRLYDALTTRCIYSIAKGSFQVETEEGLKRKSQRLFLDEELQLFFRRCSFSPDGSLLLLPGGMYESNGKVKKTAYVFGRKQLNRPLYHLPGIKKAATAVCFCPVVFELQDIEKNGNVLELPYRQLFAVVSLDSILLYDTQHYHPFGVIKHIHLSFLTDVTWSSDGRLLVVSSEDGYCSIVHFSPGELGTPISFDPLAYQMEKDKMVEAKRQALKIEQSKASVEQPQTENGSTKMTPGKGPTPSQPTLEMLVTSSRKRKRPKSKSPSNNEQTAVQKPSSSTNGLETVSAQEKASPVGLSSSPKSSGSSTKPPRRINLLTLNCGKRKVGDENDTSMQKINSKVTEHMNSGTTSTSPSLPNSESGQVATPCTDRRDDDVVMDNANVALNNGSTISERSSSQPLLETKVDAKKPPKRVSLFTLTSKSRVREESKLCVAQVDKAQLNGGSPQAAVENDTDRDACADSKSVTATNQKGKDDLRDTDAHVNGTTSACCHENGKAVENVHSNGNCSPSRLKVGSASLETPKPDIDNGEPFIDLTKDENSNALNSSSSRDHRAKPKPPKRVALCTLQSLLGSKNVTSLSKFTDKSNMVVDNRADASSSSVIEID